jgi:DNA-binding transcriptional MerR regulator
VRLSELSRRSGISIATIKYYLREGLLQPGRPVTATQAEYDETHLHRVRLIRALIGVRGLKVHTVKRMLDAASNGEFGIGTRLGEIFSLLPAPSSTLADETAPTDTDEVSELLETMGWTVAEHHPARSVIGRSLHTLRSLGLDYGWKNLLPYAHLASQTAALDLEELRSPLDPAERAERAVLLTTVLEASLLALRRLALESAARMEVDSDLPGGLRPPREPDATDDE